MNNYLCYDIETVKNDKAEEYIEKFKKYTAPSNYKDKEKIKQFILNSKTNDLGRAGLSWITGKIICITAYGILGDTSKSFYGDVERDILTGFFDMIEDGCYSGIIGKNNTTFDNPFVIGRAMFHNIGIPNLYRSYKIDDIDKFFGWSSQSSQRGKLNDYAFALDLPLKTMNGSDVQALYNEAILGKYENWEEISNYCMNDTAIVAEIVKRYNKKYEKGGK